MLRAKARRHDRLWFYVMLLFFLAMGTGAAWKQSLWMLLGAELLAFLLTALLPFCRRRECLWVSVLTVMVWSAWDVRLASLYSVMFWARYPGWMRSFIGIESLVILLCAEVLGAGLVARALWKRQKWEL